MDPCLGHLNPIESVLKMRLPKCWISRVIWRQFFKHLRDDSATAHLLFWKFCWCTEVLVLALRVSPFVGVTAHHGEGRLAQPCDQCIRNKAAQCRARSTCLTTQFNAAGCCPADTKNLLQLWMPMKSELVRGCWGPLSRRWSALQDCHWCVSPETST